MMTRQDVYNEILQDWHPVLDKMTDQDLSLMVSRPMEEWPNILQKAREIILQQQNQQQNSVLSNGLGNTVMNNGSINTGITNTGIGNTGIVNNATGQSGRSHNRYKNNTASTVNEVKVENVEEALSFGNEFEEEITETLNQDFNKVVRGFYMDMDKHAIGDTSVVSRRAKRMDIAKIDKAIEMEVTDERQELIVPETSLHVVKDGLIHSTDSFGSISCFNVLFEELLSEQDEPADLVLSDVLTIKEMIFSSAIDAKGKVGFINDITINSRLVDLVSTLRDARETYIIQRDQLQINVVNSVLDEIEFFTRIALKLSGDSLRFDAIVEDIVDVLLMADHMNFLEDVVLSLFTLGDSESVRSSVDDYLSDEDTLIGVPLTMKTIYMTPSMYDLFLEPINVGSTSVLSVKFHKWLIPILDETPFKIMRLVGRDRSLFYISPSPISRGDYSIYRQA